MHSHSHSHTHSHAPVDYSRAFMIGVGHEHFGIIHSTIQVERGDAGEPCAQADEASV